MVLATESLMTKSNDGGIVVMIRALILLYVDKNEFVPLFGIEGPVYIQGLTSLTIS